MQPGKYTNHQSILLCILIKGFSNSSSCFTISRSISHWKITSTQWTQFEMPNVPTAGHLFYFQVKIWALILSIFSAVISSSCQRPFFFRWKMFKPKSSGYPNPLNLLRGEKREWLPEMARVNRTICLIGRDLLCPIYINKSCSIRSLSYAHSKVQSLGRSITHLGLMCVIS